MNLGIIITFIVLLFTTTACFGFHHHHRAPIIDLNGAEEAIGTIRENERVVTVTPHLKVLRGTGPVCHYELTPSGDTTKEVPFEAHVLDNALGTVKISLREGAEIDCSDVEYQLRLVAVRCADDSKSEPVTLKVSIQDVNDHAPEFEAPWYSFDVEEGRTLEIARLYATDKDCGHPYGKICRYEITSPPKSDHFRIDDQGVLRLTRPLNYTQAESHILTIVAYDCGMLRSKSTLVTVHVKPRCIEGIRQHQYSPTDKNSPVVMTIEERVKRPLADVELVTCENSCIVKGAELQISLQQQQKDGMRSTVSMFAKRTQCGLNPNAVDLLNSNKTVPENIDNDEDDFDGYKEEVESDSSNVIRKFDGKSTAITVPPEALNKVIPERFTFQFSMQMNAGSVEEQKFKQNILCETDLQGLNRHHFAVYVRHCKLELLLRREPENAESEFRAAEWRWFDPRVCDGAWHSYSILFSDLDNVQLLIDGDLFNATERNPEILDDWPLHKHKETKTRLVIGACWHGRAGKMVQHFKGQLSSMFLLPGKVEPEMNIKCLYNNAETIRLTPAGIALAAENISSNKGQTQLNIKSHSLSRASLLLQNIEYALFTDKIVTGNRLITVTGHLICQGEQQKDSKNFTRTLPSFQRNIELKKAEEIKAAKVVENKFSIEITGQSEVNSNRRSLKTGAVLLPSIQIHYKFPGNKSIRPGIEIHKLDWCTIHMTPPRDMDLEFYSSPATLMTAMNVDFSHDKEGIKLKGKETAENYAEILMKIHYFNTRPETYAKRLYKLQCGEGNIMSNEFLVSMKIDADEEFKEAVEELASLTRKLEDTHPTSSVEIETIRNKENNDDEFGQMVKHFEPSFDQINSNRLQNILEMDLPRPKALHGSYDTGQTAIAGGAVAIIVVICIGMLLVLLVVGVVKMREDPFLRRRRSRKDSFEWDDNGLNVNLTVNPLEGVEKINNDAFPNMMTMFNQNEIAEDNNSCSDEDGESCREDDLSDEEEDGGPVSLDEDRRQGLEWDDDDELNCEGRKDIKSYKSNL